MSLLKKIYVLCFHERSFEPEVTRLPNGRLSENTLYVFNRIPHWADHFQSIKDYRDPIRAALYAMLEVSHKSRLETLKPPVLGVHVRMGDFRPLQKGEDFSKVGLVRTPLAYFARVITSIREFHGRCLPVTLFSDGYDHELKELLELPKVARSPDNTDIVDLLSLSRSRLIITSAGSTFSYWAGFLSDAPVILHPDHIHSFLRPDRINRSFFEGGIGEDYHQWPDLLKENIKAIS